MVPLSGSAGVHRLPHSILTGSRAKEGQRAVSRQRPPGGLMAERRRAPGRGGLELGPVGWGALNRRHLLKMPGLRHSRGRNEAGPTRTVYLKDQQRPVGVLCVRAGGAAGVGGVCMFRQDRDQEEVAAPLLLLQPVSCL